MNETTATSEMRVVTLNLWGRRGEWDERRSVLAEGFRELAPALVAFQEAVVGDGYDQVADILGRGYHIVHQTVREAGGGGDIEDGQGISIASRWPLDECCVVCKVKRGPSEFPVQRSIRWPNPSLPHSWPSWKRP